MRTRFASLTPALARLLLAALAVLVAVGLAAASAPAPRLSGSGNGDAALYRAIAERSATLPSYYAAAVHEQRARGYPLRPFVTVREPALALLTRRLGPEGTARAWQLLALLAAVAVACAFARTPRSRTERIAAVVLAAASALLLAQPALATWHEAWAGMLLAAGATLAGGRRWWAACLLGLAALLVRELALPAATGLLLAALSERRRGEAFGWAAVLALFALAMAGHAAMVTAATLPGDGASPGWSRYGGWGFALNAVGHTSLFLPFPAAITAILLPLALLGWAAPATGFTDRVALMLLATLAPFMLVGRPDNFYWGLMVAPLVAPGLAFAPRAIADLARQAAGHTPSVAAWTRSASS